MILQFCLLFFTISSKFGHNLPVFYKETQKNPSCNFWSQTHPDKSFFYLIGTAASLEIAVLRLREYIQKELYQGETSSPIEDADDVEVDEDESKDEDDDVSEIDALIADMKKLRKRLNEYHLPRLEQVIATEEKMTEYNSQPFLKEFSFLQVKARDLDCLLDYWMKQRNPDHEEETYVIDEVTYRPSHIISEEMKLLHQLAIDLDRFLSSEALVSVVRHLVKSRRSYPGEDDNDNNDDNDLNVRQLSDIIDYYSTRK